MPNGSPFEVDKSEQRLALITRARARVRAAADLREPGRRTGRAGVRRRLVRRQRGRTAGAGAAVLEGQHRADRVGADGRGLALRRAHDLRGGAAPLGRLPRDGARPARLRAEEQLSRRAAGHVGRHRLGAHGRGGRGCARAAARARRAAAVAVHHAAEPRRRRRIGAAAGHAAATRWTSRRPWPAAESALSPLFAGLDARRHRGEPAGARARPAADGPLEQVRRPAGDHRQQVGDVGRLRHAVRRHVRRLLGAEGRLQDRGLRAVALAQRASARRRAWVPRDA